MSYLAYDCPECGKPRQTSAEAPPARCVPCEMGRREGNPTRSRPHHSHPVEATRPGRFDHERYAAVLLPPGFYAVEFAGRLGFYRVEVDPATGGRWFSRYSSDDLLPVGAAERAAVVPVIAADPAAAGRTFAAETRRCWHCAKRLTNELSRSRSVGPECWVTHGHEAGR